MSIVAFKKKSVIRHGTNRSAKPPGGHWLPQGPFGLPSTTNSVMLAQSIENVGPVGFSLEGGRRSISVGQDMKMSRMGTKYRGVHPIGYGGRGGSYYQTESVLNEPPVKADIRGNQYKYIKPSVLSTRGMLQQRYKWAYNGQYPNYWVQPNYGSSNLSENTSQGLYIHDKSAANDTVVDVNGEAKYEGHIVNRGPTGCKVLALNYNSDGTQLSNCVRINRSASSGTTMGMLQSNAPYTKTLHIPQTSSQHTLRIQRRCADPTPSQKPFPYATNGDSCNNSALNTTVPI